MLKDEVYSNNPHVEDHLGKKKKKKEREREREGGGGGNKEIKKERN
jgi:hypothetical protein